MTVPRWSYRLFMSSIEDGTPVATDIVHNLVAAAEQTGGAPANPVVTVAAQAIQCYMQVRGCVE